MTQFTAARRLFLSAALLVLAAPQASADIGYSAYHDYRVDSVVEGLVRPWSMAFLPNGDMLVTEKAGTLRIVRDGKLLKAPVAGLPDVYSEGQAGLLDVVPHPDFEKNRLLYITYSKPLEDGESTTAVIRGRFKDDKLGDVEELFEAKSRGRGHYGSRLAFDGNGYIFVSIGDRQARPQGDLEAHPSQDLSNHHGVVIRLHEDGRVPEDNPFVDDKNALPEIWSYGHRNPQGLIADLESGRVWVTEHGPQGGDELNLIAAGANYGWPVIGFGVNYGSGDAIHASTRRDGMEQPVRVWVPSIGTSGLAVYDGDQFPRWRGSLLAGGLSGNVLSLLHMDGEGVKREEELVNGLGRIRDVRVGPEGAVYLAIDARDEEATGIFKLTAVARTEP